MLGQDTFSAILKLSEDNPRTALPTENVQKLFIDLLRLKWNVALLTIKSRLIAKIVAHKLSVHIIPAYVTDRRKEATYTYFNVSLNNKYVS